MFYKEIMLAGLENSKIFSAKLLEIANLLLNLHPNLKLLKLQTMNVIKIFIAAFCLSLATAASAQLTKEQVKQRQEIKKSSKKVLQEKATKEARKEAKRLKKERWQTVPGALPLEKQVDKGLLMESEFDEDLFPRYIMGTGMSIGQNYDGAKMQAIELAKQDIAGQIQTEVTALIENSVSNNQLDPAQAETVTKSIMAGKSLISQSLGRVLPVLEIYRPADKKDKTNKNKEVMVRLAYDGKMAKIAAKKAARAGLEQEGQELQEKLDSLLGW